jgi:hypothetical protein
MKTITRSIAVAATLVTFGFATGPAAAKTISIGYVSFSTLANVCGKVKGN